jgi:hypothetical protein
MPQVEKKMQRVEHVQMFQLSKMYARLWDRATHLLVRRDAADKDEDSKHRHDVGGELVDARP